MTQGGGASLHDLPPHGVDWPDMRGGGLQGGTGGAPTIQIQDVSPTATRQQDSTVPPGAPHCSHTVDQPFCTAPALFLPPGIPIADASGDLHMCFEMVRAPCGPALSQCLQPSDFGGAPCTVPALFPRCVKSRLCSTRCPPMAKVTAVTTVFLCTGSLRFLLSPKTQIMSEHKLCFRLKMPECCLNPLVLLRGRSPPVVGGVQGGHGNADLFSGALCPCCARAVRALCRNAPLAPSRGEGGRHFGDCSCPGQGQPSRACGEKPTYCWALCPRCAEAAPSPVKKVLTRAFPH